jgi:hypothetical protein
MRRPWWRFWPAVENDEQRVHRRIAVREWWGKIVGALVLGVALVWVRSQIGAATPETAFTLARALTAMGLIADVVGVWILASGLVLSGDRLAQVGTWDYQDATRPRAIGASEEARLGLGVAVLGFLLQLAGDLV